MELLNQMDGFDQTVNVKVIMATNRADTLDPALLRPGRLDRKIEFPLPDRRQKRLVFQVSLPPHASLVGRGGSRCCSASVPSSTLVHLLSGAQPRPTCVSQIAATPPQAVITALRHGILHTLR